MRVKLQPLPEPPAGFRFYRKRQEVLRCPDLLAYQHLVLKAWTELKLSGVLTLNGVPTVYISDSTTPLTPREAAERQLLFWNQGLATVLLLRDPKDVRVFSAMQSPLDPAKADDEAIDSTLVESLKMATQGAWATKFYLQLGTGNYYNRSAHRDKFDPTATVDSYLLDNLERVRNELVTGKQALAPAMAHAFIGRILFTCYLCHRGIIKLENYIPGMGATDLLEFLQSASATQVTKQLFKKLFPKLKKEFNSSMFDEGLEAEVAAIKPRHIAAVIHFLEGSEVASGQRTLGFSAYRFDYIPVETISSVYEKFLDYEDESGKRELGAYYTPRLLAEMTLDIALKDRKRLSSLRFLDPSCGSGIFLVLVFNRLVAEWQRTAKKSASVPEKAEALRQRLGQLCGVDRNPTACRITCFSLYLAFLDQFTPADVRHYVAETGHKLPNLLNSPGTKKPDLPVIWHRDFTELDEKWQKPFDLVVGNPPWVGRGTKQIANKFMKAAPLFLKPKGTCAFILPTKIFFNKTDEFQKDWLRQITLETVVQLADYRFILFKGAICPSVIARFSAKKPDANHTVEFIAPKVTRTELRDGLIPVGAADRKWIPLRKLLSAADQKAIGMAWKSYLWGTQRDRKLLSYLLTLPRLGEMAHQLRGRKTNNSGKRWITGQGCKPRKKNSKGKLDRKLRNFSDEENVDENWADEDLIVLPEDVENSAFVSGKILSNLGDHFTDEGYVPKKLYSKPPSELFKPPFVLVNQGFSSSAFFDFPVRFQDSLQSFSGGKSDTELLQLLSVFFTSKLARYFAFHTSANIGTERDKVHLVEVLRFPFFAPEEAREPQEAAETLKKISDRFQVYMEAVKKSAAKLSGDTAKAKKSLGPLFDEDGDTGVKELERAWKERQRVLTNVMREAMEPLIYDYFSLTEQDIALVEDTCEIFDRSDTPGSLEKALTIPTLQPLSSADELREYGDQICSALNRRVSGKLLVAATGMIHSSTGLALLELRQVRTLSGFKTRRSSDQLLQAADELQKACRERLGETMEFYRAGWFFEGKKIFILKPCRVGEWTRTAALNDAMEIYQHIQSASQASRA